MGHLAVAGPDLDRPDPALFRNVERVREVWIIIDALGGDGHFVERHGQIRLAELPALEEGRKLGEVARVALRRARVDPSCDGVDLVLHQPTVVLEEAMPRVGEPGWHLATLHLVLDAASPGPHFGIRSQGHRRQLTRTVTGHAAFIQDRGHVARERHVVLRRHGGTKATHHRCQDQRRADDRSTAEPAGSRHQYFPQCLSKKDHRSGYHTGRPLSRFGKPESGDQLTGVHLGPASEAPPQTTSIQRRCGGCASLAGFSQWPRYAGARHLPR